MARRDLCSSVFDVPIHKHGAPSYIYGGYKMEILEVKEMGPCDSSHERRTIVVFLLKMTRSDTVFGGTPKNGEVTNDDLRMSSSRTVIVDPCRYARVFTLLKEP